jgi:Zn-dependent membrane protease YugP
VWFNQLIFLAPALVLAALVPVTQFGSHAAYLLFLLGMLVGSLALMKVGVLLFSLAVLFALVTLPVEWDASARAKRLMVTAGVCSPEERQMAARVLNAAFLTYVAAVIMALMQLLYYLMRVGLLGGRRRD